MTNCDRQKVDGIIQQGHGVASGTASDSPYPRGTIEIQSPFFKALGLDLAPFFPGTLNVSIHPNTFELLQPEWTFPQVKWIEGFPAEDFSFSRCQLLFADVAYNALVYYPHPETKVRHFQNPSILEILAPSIPGIQYGSAVAIAYNPVEIRINSRSQ